MIRGMGNSKGEAQKRYKDKHRERGLCPACASEVAVKKIMQGREVVFTKKLLYCWRHHKKFNLKGS